jgi:hypothetical protein
MAIAFDPMRSLIFIRVAKEQYRHKLRHWLYRYHIADSIAQFEPYVSKYTFYPALPVPPGGEEFGAHNFQLTEHYWMVSDFDPAVKNKTFTEFFPPEVLRWQGNIPDVDPGSLPGNLDGDRAREADCAAADSTTSPFIFAFVPVWWDEELKGKGRTAEDGANYRWMTLISYPEGVSGEEGDKWFFGEFIPVFQNHPAATRILTSKVRQDVNHCPYHRLFEIWFDGPEEWAAAIRKAKDEVSKPAWATLDAFPYLSKYTGYASLFLSDIAESDNLTQYRGYITMR